MANHTVAHSKHATLGANTEDVVSISNRPYSVMVANRAATNPIYFTIDGSVATVAGDNTYLVMPNDKLIVNSGQPITQVRVKSAGAQDYSVVAL